MNDIDGQLYHIPFAGWAVKRLYGYFRKHIALTDLFHIVLGFGMALVVAGENMFMPGAALVISSVLYHIWALVHG